MDRLGCRITDGSSTRNLTISLVHKEMFPYWLTVAIFCITHNYTTPDNVKKFAFITKERPLFMVKHYKKILK